MVSSHPSWTSAVQAASRGGGVLKGRRVRVTLMKARQELVGKVGTALSCKRDDFGMRYEVLLDDGETLRVLARSLEVVDTVAIEHDATLLNIGVDELCHVITQVLFRNEGFSDEASRSASLLTTSAKRFAALSSVSIGWLQATKAAASAKLAQLRNGNGITLEAPSSSQFPRIAGRALMMRMLHVNAAVPVVWSPGSRITREAGVHVMTGEASTWHFRYEGEAPDAARARALEGQKAAGSRIRA